MQRGSSNVFWYHPRLKYTSPFGVPTTFNFHNKIDMIAWFLYNKHLVTMTAIWYPCLTLNFLQLIRRQKCNENSLAGNPRGFLQTALSVDRRGIWYLSVSLDTYGLGLHWKDEQTHYTGIAVLQFCQMQSDGVQNAFGTFPISHTCMQSPNYISASYFEAQQTH